MKKREELIVLLDKITEEIDSDPWFKAVKVIAIVFHFALFSVALMAIIGVELHPFVLNVAMGGFAAYAVIAIKDWIKTW